MALILASTRTPTPAAVSSQRRSQRLSDSNPIRTTVFPQGFATFALRCCDIVIRRAFIINLGVARVFPRAVLALAGVPDACLSAELAGLGDRGNSGSR